MIQGILYNLLPEKTTALMTGAPVISSPLTNSRAIQAIVEGTGAVSATIVIEAANTPFASAWMEMGTITLSGNNAVTNGDVLDIQWMYTRARLTAISGTGAAVTCNMAV